MVKLYDKGVYLLNGTEITESPEEVKANPAVIEAYLGKD